MIAAVAFFTEGPVLEGMLMSDVWSAAVCNRVREILARAGTWLKDVEFVGGIWCGAEERAKEGQLLWGVQC